MLSHSMLTLARSVHRISAAKRCFTITANARDSAKLANKQQIDIDELLAKPTWSVSSLLPRTDDPDTSEVSSKQLRHLLRLSALPPPRNDEDEAKMIQTLTSQLHFVKEVQKANTTGVEPLQSLRDETAEGEQAAELGLEALKEALASEEVRGKFHRRIRRRHDGPNANTRNEWNVLGTAGKKTGRYFVVEGGKE